MCLNYNFVIKINNELLLNDESWMWSGYHATTSEVKYARFFKSADDAESYYNENCGVIKGVESVEFTKLGFYDDKLSENQSLEKRHLSH